MYIARILYPVKVLGPGNRVGIWFDGCIHHCKGCSNPELWELQNKYKTDLKTVMAMIGTLCKEHDIDGFTLTGGDPFYQPDAMSELLPELCKISTDVLCYTGYRYEELKGEYSNILKNIAVLVDGKYIEERNKSEVIRGSDNQNIIVLKSEYETLYNEYCQGKTSAIQNFYIPGGVISVGIHRPGYEKELDAKLKEKGVKHTNE